MLGVYLIHDNNFVRPWLWRNLWAVPDHIAMNWKLYLPWSVLVIFITFLSSILIELARAKLFQKPTLYAGKFLEPLDKIAKDFFQTHKFSDLQTKKR